MPAPLLIALGAGAVGAGLYWLFDNAAESRAEEEAKLRKKLEDQRAAEALALLVQTPAVAPSLTTRASQAVSDFMEGETPEVKGVIYLGTVSAADVREAHREAKYAHHQASEARQRAREEEAEARQERASARKGRASVRVQQARGEEVSARVEEEEAYRDVEAASRGEDYTPESLGGEAKTWTEQAAREADDEVGGPRRDAKRAARKARRAAKRAARQAGGGQPQEQYAAPAQWGPPPAPPQQQYAPEQWGPPSDGAQGVGGVGGVGVSLANNSSRRQRYYY